MSKKQLYLKIWDEVSFDFFLNPPPVITGKVRPQARKVAKQRYSKEKEAAN